MNSTNISLKQRRRESQASLIKRFKEKEKFIYLVSQLGIQKNNIIFKINVFKLCERYPKLLRSFIRLGFFKNYRKGIKTVCGENEEDFR